MYETPCLDGCAYMGDTYMGVHAPPCLDEGCLDVFTPIEVWPGPEERPCALATLCTVLIDFQENAPPWDFTVGLCPGSYGGRWRVGVFLWAMYPCMRGDSGANANISGQIKSTLSFSELNGNR